MNEGHCKDCGWLKQNDCYKGRGNAIGDCTCEKIGDYGEFECGIDGIQYEYNEGGNFVVGPEFGCVHFKERV